MSPRVQEPEADSIENENNKHDRYVVHLLSHDRQEIRKAVEDHRHHRPDNDYNISHASELGPPERPMLKLRSTVD